MRIISTQNLYSQVALPAFLPLITLITCLQAQSLDVIPEFIYDYESDSEQYSTENLPIQNYEVAITSQYKSSKLNILSRMGYHLIDGMNKAPTDFTHEQGLHWFEHAPGIGDDQRNYYIADMKLQYGDSTSYLYLNKWDKCWGPGMNSLIISNKIPSFFHFGFVWEVTDNIHFEYFHGKLKSGISDSNYIELYENRTIDIVRNIVAHRLEWQPFKQIIIAGSESVLYASRFIDMTYLIPFVPFYSLQSYIGELDNPLISGDIQFLPNDNFRVYGVILIDDWSPPYTFKLDNNNKFGWQTGLEWKNITMKEDRFLFEYSWTDHRIYHHKFNVNDYYSWDYPLGFWAGPHAEEIYIDYSFKLGNNQIQTIFSNAKRGEFTDYMRGFQSGQPSAEVSKYERFSGNKENKIIIKMSLSRNINENFNFSIIYTYVDWRNAGNIFNAEESGELILENGIDLLKHSIGFGVRYRY